jgi:hypothetical protein
VVITNRAPLLGVQTRLGTFTIDFINAAGNLDVTSYALAALLAAPMTDIPPIPGKRHKVVAGGKQSSALLPFPKQQKPLAGASVAAGDEPPLTQGLLHQ